MFHRQLSLCVAILTKLFQEIIHGNELSVSLDNHDFNRFCNLSRLIFKKGGITLVLANHKKGIFPLKRAFLRECRRPGGRLSNQISSFRLATH